MSFWSSNISKHEPKPLDADTLLRGIEKIKNMPHRICGLDYPHGPFHPDQIRRGGWGVCWNCGRAVDFGEGREP